MLVDWWTGLGSSQLFWTDYEPSCAQNMDLTTHTHPYIQNIYYTIRNSKGIAKDNLKC